VELCLDRFEHPTDLHEKRVSGVHGERAAMINDGSRVKNVFRAFPGSKSRESIIDAHRNRTATP
jgi:hypothetical protein